MPTNPPKKKENKYQLFRNEQYQFNSAITQLSLSVVRLDSNFETFIFSLLVFAAFIAILPVASASTEIRQGNLEKELEKNSKIIIDPIANPDHLKCENIPKSILRTTEILPYSESYIKRVLANDAFSIVCTTKKRINEQTNRNSYAFFDPLKKTISLPSDNIEISSSFINHEFIHADNFFRHQKNPCNLTVKQGAALPIFPPSEDNIAKYNKALDKGDTRINEYLMLWYKSKKNETLSLTEVKLLKKYTAAATKCLRTEVEYKATLSDYKAFLNQGWVHNKDKKTLSNGFFIRKILSFEESANGIKILFYHIDPALSIYDSLERVRFQINEKYKNSSLKLKLIERDAYTFQDLSKEAVETFYPEANALKQADIKKCESGLKHQFYRSEL